MCFPLESRSRTWQTFKLYLTKFSLSFATNRKQNLMLAHLGHIISGELFQNSVIDKFIKMYFLQKSTLFPNTHYELKY